MTKQTIDWYARSYVENFGFHIVPIEPGRKYPRTQNWGNRAISDPEQAAAFYESRQDWNMGVALGPSRLCSLDIDCMESFRTICDAFGVDLDELIESTPTIQGRDSGARLMFRVPDGAKLPYAKLNWRPEADPTGDKYRDLLAQAREIKKQYEEMPDGDEKTALVEEEQKIRADARSLAPYTVFELRSSCDGTQRQDVLPPSIHPDTGQPYQWISQPRKDWPQPPKWLLSIWLEFDKVRQQLLAACPWAVINEIYKPSRSQRTPVYAGEGGGLVAVVNEYNRQVSIESALLNYGYEKHGKRFLAPSSDTKLPGVVVFEDSNKAWIHHASDPLCSDETKRPVAPFDLLCHFEHGGDFKRAATSLSESMGVRTNTPSRATIDYDTGEVLDTVNDTDDSDSPPPLPLDDEPVNYLKPLPWTGRNGRPLKHHDNLREILRRINVTVRYNVIKKREEVLIPKQSFSIDNHDNASLAYVASQCSLFDYPTDKLQEFITLLADKNPFNPVATWITSKPWDGYSRLPRLFETITCSPGFDNELKNLLMRKWLLSAVAAAFSPNGVVARGVLVFQGKQQIGKTAWFKSLVPAHLGVIQDGVILRPDDKDSVKQTVSNWLVELGELDATFKRSDIAQLKGFITRDQDVLRVPFARRESTFARRTVFFGSVNPREFLNDPTGNTRFWTIPCDYINWQHEIDMQQVWAEVYYLYNEGESHHLDYEQTKYLETANHEYLSIDPIEERIMSQLEWSDAQTLWRWAQATDVLIECGLDRPSRGDATKAASVIRKMNNNQAKRGASGERLLLVPRRKFEGA